jgi:cytoskeletal protein CcmA (bactofilin family)
MGIINRNDQQESTGVVGNTIIAAGTSIVGDITLKDSLHVDGSLNGDVISESDVSIGRNGKLDGSIRAKHVVVSGQFGGSITCDRLEIVSEGRVTGEVEAAQLVIEAGGQFSGASRIKDEEPRQIPFQPGKDQAKDKAKDDPEFDSVINN